MYFIRSGIPYVRFFVFFSIGIFLGIIIYPKENFIPIILTTLLFFIGYVLERYWEVFNWLKDFFSFMTLVALGFTVVMINIESNDPKHYLHSIPGIDYYEGVVVEMPEEKEKSTKLVLELNRLKKEGNWVESKGKILVYISNKADVIFKEGQILIVKGSPKIPIQARNPNEFDYCTYLKSKSIYSIHYVSKNEFKIVGFKETGFLYSFAASCRSYCEETLSKGIHGENEYQIAKALLLGLKSEMDPSLYSAYSATGTIHTLAVSGMHVSLLYVLITAALGFLKKLPFGDSLFVGVSILLLWLYALITGLTPSIVRAVTMFSVLLVAGCLKRNTSVFNNLFFTAFVLLLIKPFWLTDIGFQFSFLAVVGIVYIYPIISCGFEIKSKLLLKIWELLCISFSAQLAVAPLSIYYFHNFPVLFLFFNLLIVPMSSIAMYTGIAGLFFSKLDWLANFFYCITAYILEWMNALVVIPMDWSFVKIDGVYLTILEVISLYFILLLFFLGINKKSFVLFKASLFLVIFYCLFSWYFFISDFNKVKFTLYNVDQATFFSFIYKGVPRVYYDSKAIKRINEGKGIVRNHFVDFKNENSDYVELKENSKTVRNIHFGQLVNYNGITLIRIEKRIKEKDFIECLKIADIIILSNKINIDIIRKYKTTKIILVDSCIDDFKETKPANLFFVSISGAFSKEW